MKIKSIIAVLFIAQLFIGLSSCNGTKSRTENGSDVKPATTQQVAGKITKLSAKDYFKAIDNKDVVLIDVRTLSEYKSGHIKNAKMIDVSSSTFKSLIANEDMNQNIYIYCRSGARSGRAAKTMKQLGFKNVYDLSGGVMGWSRNNFPLVK